MTSRQPRRAAAIRARTTAPAWWLLCAAAFAATLLLPGPGQAQVRDDYAEMLGYLAQTRIDQNALAGSTGAIAVNQAAGDLNQQANLRAIAVGSYAIATVDARQRSDADVYDAPARASAVIGGSALAGASGIASINQASGSGNAELNAVSMVVAQQGTREGQDGPMSASAFASAERQRARNPAGKTASRNVAVEATALRGFEGVLQLNQIAGSANATGNSLMLSISTGP
ncbi:hypothetical protein [Pseudoxanthomonas koreensis]|uniref:hypothetical protein n=1 Tax=Pseudoxanthomonas koreensis TaxID=266061 RepID=UPI003CCD7205